MGFGPEKYPRIIAKTCPLGPDFIHAVCSGIGEVAPEDLLHVSSLGFDSSIQLFNLISRETVKVTKMEIDQCSTLKVISELGYFTYSIRQKFELGFRARKWSQDQPVTINGQEL